MRARVAACCVFLFAMVMGGAASASAADHPAPRWGQQTPTPDGGVQRVLRDGSGKAVAGVSWHPAKSGHTGRSGAVVSPQTASGCDPWGGREVCIYVYGDGLHVDEWDTNAYGNWGCTSPGWFLDGNQIQSAGQICPNTPDWGVYQAWWSPNANYQDGQQACNQWTYSLSRPCEWIEA